MSATFLDRVVADLRYAGGTGGSRLGAQAAAAGRASAELDAAVGLPGPGLVQLLGHAKAHRVYADANPAAVDPATAKMAEMLADGGVALALGGRR